MQIYLLTSLVMPSVHPLFGHIGTWSEPKITDPWGTCSLCGNHDSILLEPLQIEWLTGSTEIGDFSWCGYTAVVLDHVRDWLVKSGFEVRFGRVEVQKPKGKKGRMPRVPFPYVGPHLNWMISEKRVLLDEERSGIEKVPDCKRCGQKRTKFVRKDIFIPRANWKGEKLFIIEQNGKSGAMFITEEAASLLHSTKFSNYVLRPAGIIG